jgi:hypothetical protein
MHIFVTALVVLLQAGASIQAAGGTTGPLLKYVDD